MSSKVTQIDTGSAPDSLLEELADYYVVIDDEEIPGDTPMPTAARIADWRKVSSHYPVFRWVSYDEDGIAGAAVVAYSAEQNLENGYGRVHIHPEKRRRGHGRALARAMFDHLEAAGRPRFDTMIKKDTPSEDLARRLELKPVYEEKRSRLLISDLDDELMGSWIDRANESAVDYELVYVPSPIPDDMLEPFCALAFVMNTAPREDFEEDDEVLTPESWRETETNALESGGQLHNLIAVHRPTGELVGFTQINTLDLEPDLAWQWDTAVDPSHRNRGLGRWLKAAMIDKVVKEFPLVRRVDTYNAGSNEPMLAINVEMGFRPIHIARAWQGSLATARERLGA
jgi:GNAT superfamily N-acetyltransferase